MEVHAEKHHPQEWQSFLNGSNQPLFVDHPPIILGSLEAGDNTLNPKPIDSLYVENNDHNYENILDKDYDEIDFILDLLELDIPSLDNNTMCGLMITNYVYQPPPPGSQCYNLSKINLFSTPESNIYY